MRLTKGLPVAVRLMTGMAVLALTLVVPGCGSSESDQVKAKVEQLARASASRDYKVLCNQVLAPSLLQRLKADGISCQQAMQAGLSTVGQPTVSVGKITISGSQASAITLSFATGRQMSLDTVQLVKTGGGWRVSSVSPTVG